VNFVDCTGAPNCIKLRRLECMNTAGTCGSCQKGLIGTELDTYIIQTIILMDD
jgi:RNA polymerase-binding transcription factor DksA